MSTVEHEAQSHHLPPAVVANQQRRAVLFFILADAVFFACLLFTYFYLRAQDVQGGWLPDGASTASAWLIWLIAGVTVLSAVGYRAAERAIQAGQRSRFLSMTLVGTGLVVVAAVLMVIQMMTWSLLMSDGSYASTFIVMTGVQLVHLVLLLVVALGIWNRGVRGMLDDGHDNHAVLVGYYWYWVALLALLGALTSLFA